MTLRRVLWFTCQNLLLVSATNLCPKGAFQSYTIVSAKDAGEHPGIGNVAANGDVLLPVASCQPCPVGTFGGGGLATYCTKCPRGSSTPKAGAVENQECTVCAPGYRLFRLTQGPRIGVIRGNSLSISQVCLPCAPGSTSVGGIYTTCYCTQCPGDLVSNPALGQPECKCPNGFIQQPENRCIPASS